MHCSSPDFNISFGLMHTVEKSAEIYIKVRSASGIRQTMTSANLKKVAKAFKYCVKRKNRISKPRFCAQKRGFEISSSGLTQH